jgi:hypothetical protein
MAKTLREVINSLSIEGGHAIQIELEFDDDTRETIRCETQNAPKLAQAIAQASIIAERQRKAAPGQAIGLDVPHYATSVRVVTAVDDSQVAMQFGTKAGFPVMVSMTPSLAHEAIGKLSVELANLGRQPPPRKN